MQRFRHRAQFHNSGKSNHFRDLRTVHFLPARFPLPGAPHQCLAPLRLKAIIDLGHRQCDEQELFNPA